MTTKPIAYPRRHPTPFRKDEPQMFHIEFRFAEAIERHERFRAEADRGRMFKFLRRSLRCRLGGSLVRLGHQVGGDAMTSRAWQA